MSWSLLRFPELLLPKNHDAKCWCHLRKSQRARVPLIGAKNAANIGLDQDCGLGTGRTGSSCHLHHSQKNMMWHDSQLSISKNNRFVFLWLGQAQLQNSIAASRELTWIGGYNIPGYPGWVLKGCDQLSQSRRLSIKKLSLKAVKAMDTTLPLRRCRAQLKTKLSSPWCVDPVTRWWALKQQALRHIPLWWSRK